MVTDEASGMELWRSINLVGAIFSVAVGDLDADGVKDIVAVASGEWNGGHLFQFNGASHVQWQSMESEYTAVTTMDIDGDGREEVLAGTAAGVVRVLDGITHAEVGTLQAGSGIVDAVRAFRDPPSSAVRLVVLVGGQLRAFDLQSGTLLATAPHQVRGTHALEVMDADGDNQIEVFVGGEAAFRAYRLVDDTIFRNGFD